MDGQILGYIVWQSSPICSISHPVFGICDKSELDNICVEEGQTRFKAP